MSERQETKERRRIRRFISVLLSNMKWFDRWRFVFTGNYYKPLQRTLNHLKK